MKNLKFVCLICLVAVIPVFMGCATPRPIGLLYTELKLPIDAEGDMSKASTKIGVAECQSVLGLVANGDASIERAMKNGGITKIHYVDWEVKNILGVIGNYKVIVHGE